MKKLLIAFMLCFTFVSVASAQRINTSKELNEYIDYAYWISGNDMNFILTLEAESRWDINAIGDGGRAFGLCQINTNYHKLPIGYLGDIKTQINSCYDMYADWKKKGILHKRLYGFNRRFKYSNLYK